MQLRHEIWPQREVSKHCQLVREESQADRTNAQTPYSPTLRVLWSFPWTILGLGLPEIPLKNTHEKLA